jgi:hypothetical protein
MKPKAQHAFRAISSAPVRCKLRAGVLVVPPYRVPLHGSCYVSAVEVRIDLSQVLPGRYRVLAVHNFHVEDVNPCLEECVSAVFLSARRSDGSWEEPERFPVECRALVMIGVLRVASPL